MHPVSVPLLTTKLYLPPARQSLVTRPRLMVRLTEGFARPFLLISAPAGFGKTTLLSEWHQRCAQPFAWISLDRHDNAPERFWLYFITALQQLKPSLGGELLPLLTNPTPQPVQIEFFLTALLNQITAAAEPLTVVLDDYHVITSQPIHDGMIFLLDHMPHNLHLVLLTRADPPFPLGRLRARNQMVEIRTSDLSFTSEEAGLFFNQVMRLNLNPAEISALETRTEGWITGMQLAALSMQSSKDIASFISAFTGSHRYILDYLVEEVFLRLPETLQSFLMQTSVLSRMTGSLCDAVTVEKDGETVLAHLDQANLFLIPLDDERRWFRYHHLFAELLQSQLLRKYPQAVPTLHTRAAGWYEQNGFPGEAVEHALVARDFPLAADILERHSHARWAFSDVPFLGLIGKLPGEILHTRPKLAVFYAWTLVISGQMAAAEALLVDLVDAFPAEDSETAELRSFVMLLLAYIPVAMGRDTDIVLPGRQVLAQVPDQSLGMRNSAEIVYAYLLYMRCDFDGAAELLMEAVRRDVSAGGTTAVPLAISRLARLRMLEGRLKEAAALCQEYLQMVQTRAEWQFYIAGNLSLLLGSILTEWNELDAAEKHIREGLRANQPWDTAQVQVFGLTALARLQYNRGNITAAAQTIEDLERKIKGDFILPDQQSELEALKVRLWIASGNLEAAGQWAAGTHPQNKTLLTRELEQIVCARVLLHLHRPAEALAILDTLAPAAEVGRRFGRLLDIKLLRALALSALERKHEAMQSLEAALSIGAGEDFIRTFVNEGEPAQALLADYLRLPSPSHAPYAQRLLGMFKIPLLTKPAQAHPFGLIEPLTDRELELLRLVASGYSNQAVSKELFITVGTVKRHLNNIFMKLGASSRTQAVAIAREMGLL